MNGSAFPLVDGAAVAATTGEAAADEGEETTRATAAAAGGFCWTASLFAQRMSVVADCCCFEADGAANEGLVPLPLPKTRFFGGRLRRPPPGVVVDLLGPPTDDAAV